MKWGDLPHGKEIHCFLEVSLKRFCFNLVPPTACLPWVAKPGYTWVRGNGPLDQYVPGLMEVIREVSDDFGRHVENNYSTKLQPRNIFHADAFDDKLNAIQWDVPIPKRILTPDLVMQTMYHEGLYKSKGLQNLFDVRAPHGVTSVGVLWDADIEQVISGAKSDVWSYVLRKAKEFMEWCTAQQFTWSSIDGRWQEIIIYLEAIYVPGVRLDRGVKKLRLLFCGNAIIYALEQLMSHGIKYDMKQDIHLAYQPRRGEQMQEFMGRVPIMSGDFEACDLHFNWKSLKAVWQAWQQVYELPESVMCALYAYNVYAPIAKWVFTENDSQLILQDKRGINPSGSGAFVIVMNLYVRSILEQSVSLLKEVPLTLLEEGDTGISFGDDHVLPDPTAELGDWVHMMLEWGQDVSGTQRWHSRFKFLRMLYGRDYSRIPIVFSRFRNACCPEDPGILKRPPELNALALRAQLLPFSVMKQTSARWKRVYEAISKILVPGKQLMMDEYPDDASLARSVDFAERELDALFFAKRAYQVDDSVKVFQR